MSTPRTRFIIAAAVVAVSILGLISWSLSGTTAYYKTPAELLSTSSVSNERVRVAGKVVADSVLRDGPITTFSISDGKTELPVVTQALLPDTFGADVEVVAEGTMEPAGVFSAMTVLAKCPSKFKAKQASG